MWATVYCLPQMVRARRGTGLPCLVCALAWWLPDQQQLQLLVTLLMPMPGHIQSAAPLAAHLLFAQPSTAPTALACLHAWHGISNSRSLPTGLPTCLQRPPLPIDTHPCASASVRLPSILQTAMCSCTRLWMLSWVRSACPTLASSSPIPTRAGRVHAGVWGQLNQACILGPRQASQPGQAGLLGRAGRHLRQGRQASLGVAPPHVLAPCPSMLLCCCFCCCARCARCCTHCQPCALGRRGHGHLSGVHPEAPSLNAPCMLTPLPAVSLSAFHWPHRSNIFLKEAVRLMRERGYTIGNIDCTIIAQVQCWCRAGLGGGRQEEERPRQACWLAGWLAGLVGSI